MRRQRLLENKTLDLATMFDQARALDSAQKNSEVYSAPPSRVLGLTTPESLEPVASKELSVESAPVTAAVGAKCFFCGSSRHPRAKCPAREAVCRKCQKKGHFAKVCQSSSSTAASVPRLNNLTDHVTLASVISAITPSSLSKAVANVFIKETQVDGLIDSGSIESFIHPDLVKCHSLTVHPSSGSVSMASTSLSQQSLGYCLIDLSEMGKIIRVYV